MSKYIKLFETEAEYQSFTGTSEFIKPNVSAVISGDTVHYNPNGEEPTPTFDGKWKAEYQNGEVRSSDDCASGTIARYEIPSSLDALYYPTKVEIGSCVNTIEVQSFNDWAFENTSFLFYPTTVPNGADDARELFPSYTPGYTTFIVYVPDSSFEYYASYNETWTRLNTDGKLKKISEFLV